MCTLDQLSLRADVSGEPPKSSNHTSHIYSVLKTVFVIFLVLIQKCNPVFLVPTASSQVAAASSFLLRSALVWLGPSQGHACSFSGVFTATLLM